MYKNTHKFINDKFFVHISTLGSFEICTLYFILLLIFELYPEALFYFVGFLIIHLIGIAIRSFVKKDRPKPTKYSGIFGKIHNSSFPSMHMARIVFVGLFFIELFKKIEFNIFMIIIIIIVMQSRIYKKKHDYYDILGGVILGIFTYYLVKLIF